MIYAVCQGDNTSCQDECGIPNGTNQDIDCNGECFGTAITDDCGICTGGSTNLEFNQYMDCAGECFGTAELDDCDECNGENSSMDCEGVCFGDAIEDCFGECNGDAQLDCSGVCEGDDTSCDDECGVPNGDNSTCSGCTNIVALNYDPEAIVDDGTCEYYSNTHWFVSPNGQNELGYGSSEYPFSSIQYAIDNISVEDTIYVSAGTYFENIYMMFKRISIIGEDPLSTIIDGGQNGRVIRFYAGHGDNYEDYHIPIIKNLTIQGGLGQGAGLFIDYHNLIGENLIIRNNTGDEGSAINTLDSESTFKNILVTNNSGSNILRFDRNAGIEGKIVTIKNSTILGNNIDDSENSFDISLDNDVNLVCVNSIYGNQVLKTQEQIMHHFIIQIFHSIYQIIQLA